MEPGVYIDLPEEEYFAADALGSSDIKTLLRETANWWYTSRHNPHFEESKDTKARILGRALHSLILEGQQAYEGTFTVEPDPNDYQGILKTTDDILMFLDGIGMDVPSAAKKSKASLVQWATDHGYGQRIWATIKAQHDQDIELFNKVPITAAQDRAMRHMAQIVEEAPTIGPALAAGLSEVSVFWRRPDDPSILFRARLDSLSPAYTLDLKSMSNWKGRSIEDMPRRQIEEFEYDIQRVYYDEARQYMREFIKQDLIYCPSGELEERAKKVLKAVAESESWVWVWLFFQLRDDKAGKAPILVPRFHQPTGEVWDQAKLKVERGIELYKTYMARFGPDTPWHEVSEVLELEDQDLANLQYKVI